MKSAVLYMSRYGTTAEYAKIIAAHIGSDSKLIDLRKEKRPDLSGYDSAIVGVSIYAGRPVIGMSDTLERMRPSLLEKPVALFITCMYEGERAQEQLVQAYPEWLYAHASLKSPFGGRLSPDTLKPLDRWILRIASKSIPAASRFSGEQARAFAEEFSQGLSTGGANA